MSLNFSPILHRQLPPEPWVEGDKIPWNEPGFSQRMLREHLAQDHDHASRRQTVIERHVHWIHHHLLAGKPGRILDLGCGPGLYLNRLAELGHPGMGIDFSPASIEYARQTSGSLPVEYHLGDLRAVDFGAGYDLVMFIFGELNVFRPDHARALLEKSLAALVPGGQLLLEVSSFDSLRQSAGAPSWYSSRQGLFSARPHIVLSESFWDEILHTVTDRYFTIDAETGSVSRVAATAQAYTDVEYRALLEGVGFCEVQFHTDLAGEPVERGDFFPITALKRR